MDREQEIKVRRRHIVVCSIVTETSCVESWLVQDAEASEACTRSAGKTDMEAPKVQISAATGPCLPFQGNITLDSSGNVPDAKYPACSEQ